MQAKGAALWQALVRHYGYAHHRGGGAEPRRLFSDDDKARIVSEAMMPGANVADVGRRHRGCPSLIYRWRRGL